MMKVIVSSGSREEARLILKHIRFWLHLILHAGQISLRSIKAEISSRTWELRSRPHVSSARFLSLQDSDVLSLGVSSHRSWWKDNGPGCERSDGLPSDGWQNQQNQQNPELTTVLSCWLEYQYIEILHCIVQLLVSVRLSAVALVWGYNMEES